MACSDDSETEWRIEARQLCSSKRDPPGRPAKACRWGWEHVPCCWITLKYCVPLLCLIGSMSALHVWKGSSKVLAPPSPQSPAQSDSCRRMTEIMADSCEIKHAFYDIKKASFFFFWSSYLSSPAATSFLLLCTAPWVDCMWRGWCIDHRRSFDNPNVEKFQLNDHLTKVPHISNSSPCFFFFLVF